MYNPADKTRRRGIPRRRAVRRLDPAAMKQTERLAAVQAALPKWFRRSKRSMPWRRTRDPYAIWVSEIMLQQTRVETVKSYYTRWMERFGTVEKLAAARIGDVLKAWEGMGYYGRARNLHKVAKQVVADFAGALPHTVPELRRLPGIGPYTAGAIASIAFGLDEPVLDGNVARVLCRLFRIRTNPAQTATRKKLWALARKLIPPGKAGRFNEAMMDLGATVCTPRSPRCDTCCVADACEALVRGEQESLPHKDKPKPIPHHDIAAGVIWKRGRILIDRRKPEGLLGGLWEFPGGKVEAGETLAQALRREVREELGIRIRVGEEFLAVDHAYSHFRITLHAMECEYVSGEPRAIGCDAFKWVRPGALDAYAFPKANRKVLDALYARLAGEKPRVS